MNHVLGSWALQNLASRAIKAATANSVILKLSPFLTLDFCVSFTKNPKTQSTSVVWRACVLSKPVSVGGAYLIWKANQTSRCSLNPWGCCDRNGTTLSRHLHMKDDCSQRPLTSAAVADKKKKKKLFKFIVLSRWGPGPELFSDERTRFLFNYFLKWVRTYETPVILKEYF